MRTIKFIERREFDYGEGLVVHQIGDVATLRDDKAQRWVTRNVAEYVEAEVKTTQILPPMPVTSAPIEIPSAPHSGDQQNKPRAVLGVPKK